MALLLHYTGQDYISRGLLNTQLTPGSTSAIVGGCKTGKGFEFDGTVNSVLSSKLDEERTIHSFSVWFKIIDINAVRFIATFGQADFLQFMLWQRVNGEFVFGYCDAEGTQINIILNSNLPRDIWYHFAATINGLEIKLYLNGSLIKTHTAVSIRKGSNKILKIGGGTTSSGMIGAICNFKYYNHVLSAREVAEDYKSLMLHYKLDKPITTQVTDYSGFNRHIAVIENTTTNSTTEKRVYGGSLANDGTKSLYGSLNLTELNGINEISVAVRFRFLSKEAGNHGYFVSRTEISGGNGIGLYKVEGASRAFYIDIAGRNAFTLPYDLVSGTWYDLVAVKRPTAGVQLFINGELIGIAPNSSSISNMGQLYASISRSIADDTLTLSNAMNGNVQDIRFYAKALTQEDVTELYQTRHMVDKDSNCYTYELIEGQTTVGMNKQGQLLCDKIIENEDGTFQIVSNKTIKTKEIKEI